MLQGALLVVLLAGLPRHAAAGVHVRTMLAVEVGRCLHAVARSLAGLTEIGVLIPQGRVRRPLVDEFRALPLPRGMPLPIQQPVGQVVGAHHSHGAQAGNPAAWAGKAENRTLEHRLARRHLRRRPGRIVGLRVVDQDEARPHLPAVRGPLGRHAADAAGDAGDADDAARRLAAGDRWELHFVSRPLDMRRLALKQLPLGPLVDSLERHDWVDRLWKILKQCFVRLALNLDGVEHRRGMPLVRTDDANKLAVAVEQGPQRRHFDE